MPLATIPPTFVPNGILDGHFDVDTATQSMPFPISSGTVSFHVHEYDKVNQTTTVDFFNMSELNGGKISSTSTGFDQFGQTLKPGDRFYLVIVNPELNPGGVLEINGAALRVTDYKKQPFVVYTTGTPSNKSDQQLSSLKIAFDSTVPAASLLVPTSPNDCVFPNIPGKYGEYRDGALVVQAIDAKALSLDPLTGAQLQNGGLLWEGIIYNHYVTHDANGVEIRGTKCYSSTFF